MTGKAVPILLGSAVLLASCVSVRPHSSVGGDVGVPTVGGGTVNRPRPTPPAGIEESRTIIDYVCRVAIRRGWIAIAYTEGGDGCPPGRDPDNLYTAATVYRYADRVVGTTIEVCADQPIPTGWIREYGQPGRNRCIGAHVEEDQPTSVLIRRVR